MRFRLAAAVLLSLSVACSGATNGPPPPPPPVALAFVVEPGPSSAVAPIAPAVKVELRDASGKLASSATLAVTLTLAPGAGSATLTGTTTVAAVAGVATFSNLTVPQAGTGYRLAASCAGLTGATSAAFDVAIGPPARLSIVAQPADGRTSTALAPALQVAVTDAAGNLTDAADVTVTLASGPTGATLLGTTVVTPAAGQAAFPDLSARGAGTYTLKASLPSGGSITTAAFSLSDAWRSIGPDGGIVFVAADPVTPLTALAGGGQFGGLWRTTDGGTGWSPVAGVRGRTLRPVFEKGGTAWAYGDSLWRSTDGGVTWTESPGLVRSSTGSVVGVAFDPVTHVAYAAVVDYESRLLVSSDAGVTWAVVAPALPAGSSVIAVAAGPGGVYILGSQGFQTLPRGGSAWTAPVSVESNPYCLVAHPTDAAVILVGGVSGLHRTADGGATWSVIAHYMVKDLWFDPANPSKLVGVALSVGVFGSTDAGATIASLATPDGYEYTSLSGTASHLYLGSDLGAQLSADGGATWAKASGGLRAGRITAVAISAGASPVLLAGTEAGELFRSTDGGNAWTRVLYALLYRVQKVIFDPATPSRAYLVNGGYPMVSTDSGATWSTMAGAPPGIGSLALCHGAPTTIWVSDNNGSGVWRTTDAGTTWAQVYTRPNPSLLVGELTADAVDPLTAYMTMIDYAPGGAATGLYRTRDGGATWNKLGVAAHGGHLASGPASGSVWSLGVYSLNVSTDFGASFTPVSPPMNGAAAALAVDPSSGTHALVGTYRPFASAPGDGVLTTTDGGTTWANARSGHDLFSTTALAIDTATPQTVYAGTYGGGLLKSTTGGF